MTLELLESSVELLAQDAHGIQVVDFAGFEEAAAQDAFRPEPCAHVRGDCAAVVASHLERHALKVEVTGIDQEAPSRKIVRPDLAMQVGAIAGADILSRDPVVGYAAGISMPWFHPTPALDILSPSVTLGTSYHPGGGEPSFVIRGGTTIISYNVGGHGQSLLKDTWVGADIGVATDLGLSGGLVLSTRL